MSEPRVSVLMPVHDPAPDYLRQAIESIRAQTLPEWELVVVEEPPAAGVKEIVASFGDSRIRHVLLETRSDLGQTLNEGLARCRATLVARMDSDDIAEPERLARQVAHMEAHPATGVLGTGLTIIDRSGRPIGRRHYPTSTEHVARAMRQYNSVAHPSVMFRRDLVLSAGGYGRGRAQDYDLWCRLLGSGVALENLPDELLRYRIHDSAVKATAARETVRATIGIKRRHFGGKMTLGDRLRLAGEYILLLLPARITLRLFRAIEFKRK